MKDSEAIDDNLYMFKEDGDEPEPVSKKNRINEPSAKKSNIDRSNTSFSKKSQKPDKKIETQAKEADKKAEATPIKKDEIDEIVEIKEIEELEPEKSKEKEEADVKADHDEKAIKPNNELKELKENKPQQNNAASFDNFDEEYNLDSKGSGKLIIGLTILAIIVLAIFIIKMDDIFANDKDTAAKVNGEKISLASFNKAYEQATAQYGSGIKKQDVLNQLIEEKLLLQEANKEQITADEAEINNFVDQWVGNIQASFGKDEFEKKLAEEGNTLEGLKKELKDAYRKQLIIKSLLDKMVLSKIEITDNEAKDYYDSNLALFATGEQVRASHILVNTSKEAIQIMQSLKKGADFAELAEQKSIDKGSGARGGDLGYFSMGQMVKPFEDAAFSLRINEISEPVETQFGYHIIKVVDKKPGVKQEFDKVKGQIKLNLAMQNNPTEVRNIVLGIIETLKKEAKIKILIKEPETPATAETPTAFVNSNDENTAVNTGNPDIKAEDIDKEEVIIGADKEISTDEDKISEEDKAIESISTDNNADDKITTFKDTGQELCTKDGKPIIRLFSTTKCAHCKWIKEAFDNFAKEHIDKGDIIAYHWELDTGDNLLTDEVETAMPRQEVAIFKQYSAEKKVPAFVFGCRYVRIGNGYEKEDSLDNEKAEFKAVISKLIEEAELKAVIKESIV